MNKRKFKVVLADYEEKEPETYYKFAYTEEDAITLAKAEAILKDKEHYYVDSELVKK